MSTKMTMDEKIKRINELYHLSKERALTKEEAAEQKSLRQDYIDSIKTELRAKLNFTYKNSPGYLTAKTTIKKELEDSDKLAILFYCGATFYIKP